MQLLDYLLYPLIAGLVLWWASQYGRKNYTASIAKYFLWGIGLKLIGSFGISIYYRNGGDTSLYYFYGCRLFEYIFSKPEQVFLYFLSSPPDWGAAEDFAKYSIVGAHRHHSSVMMYKVGAFFYLPGLGLFSLMSLCCGMFSFSGQWKIYKFFLEKYPLLERELAIACLFIPSVAFWGGGLMKDSMCMGGLGWFLYGADNVLFKGKKIFLGTFLMLFFGNMIIVLKAYILLAFLPGLVILLYFRWVGSVKSKLLKIAIQSVLILTLPIGGFVVLSSLAAISGKFSLDQALETTKGFHADHNRLADAGIAGSGYKLDISDYSAFGILKVAPQAINVALFRPYIWEVRNPAQVISAFEALGFLALFVYTLYTYGAIKTIKTFLSNPEALMCMSFTVILGFACGLTAFNFGALVRFKIPLLPFFLCALFIVKYEVQQKRFKPKRNLELNPRPTA